MIKWTLKRSKPSLNYNEVNDDFAQEWRRCSLVASCQMTWWYKSIKLSNINVISRFCSVKVNMLQQGLLYNSYSSEDTWDLSSLFFSLQEYQTMIQRFCLVRSLRSSESRPRRLKWQSQRFPEVEAAGVFFNLTASLVSPVWRQSGVSWQLCLR